MDKIIWAPRALADLENLLHYIADSAPISAKRFAQKVVRRVEQLKKHPTSGSFLSEDNQHIYRQLLQGNYRIIYRMDANVIYTVATHHAARLLDTTDLD